jgi:hypothetical protein
MTITQNPESVPQTWDDQRDNDFFRIVSSLFGAEFAFGASVLLAANDIDIDIDGTPPAVAEHAFAMAVAA